MLRVASNALIVPPFECAWLSLHDYQLDGACCLQFDCKGENDVTIILKPFPGAKRWQHLQRQQGPAGGEHLAVEDNYTVILGSHRNSKLKIEKNGDEKASSTGLPGCTVNPMGFASYWINYSHGLISVGTGAAGSSLSFHWQDPDPAIPNIRHIGLSCWDKHVSYRSVQVLPPLAAALLQQLQQQLAQQQLALQQAAQGAQQGPENLAGQAGPDTTSLVQQLPGLQVPSLLQLVMDSTIDNLVPAAVFHVLHLSELLLPRTQQLYEAAVQLAGRWFEVLLQQHVDQLAGLSLDVLADVLQEPLLDVPELLVFQAVAAWCQFGNSSHQVLEGQGMVTASTTTAAAVAAESDGAAMFVTDEHAVQQQPGAAAGTDPDACQQSSGGGLSRPVADVREALQLVRFAFMSETDRQAVLDHPFTRQCPLVQEHMQEDLLRLTEGNGSTSPEGCYTFEQRRLMRPSTAGAAAGVQPGSTANAGNAAQPEPTARAMSCDSGSFPEGSKPASGDSSRSATSSALSAGLGGQSARQTDSSRAVGWRHYRRRLAPSCKELMYVCDGDRNGVIHYIATDYGTKQWVNPVLSKALDIKASSPPSRYTDSKALVSGQFLNTSFAGPRHIRAAAAPPVQPAAGALAAAAAGAVETGVAGPAAASPATGAATAASRSTWWQLDLGPQQRLLCNYYTIRHDGSQDGFVRSWVLQGSNDLQHWLDLRRHLEDTTIRLPGQYGSWPITGPAASMPFRAFRLLLLGPTQSQTNPWAFCLSYWELYGYFYKLAGEGACTVETAAAAAAGRQGQSVQILDMQRGPDKEQQVQPA